MCAKKLASIMILFLILCSCSVPVSEKTTINGQNTIVNPVTDKQQGAGSTSLGTMRIGTNVAPDGENIGFAYPTYPVLLEGGFLPDRGPMQFYDLNTAKTYTLCARSGCKHSDNSCPAWRSDKDMYTVYKNTLYALLCTEKGSGMGFSVCRRTITENHWDVLWSVDTTPYTVYDFAGRCGNDYMAVLLTKVVATPGEAPSKMIQLLSIDLNTSDVKEISLSSITASSYQLFGVASGYAVVGYNSIPDNLPTLSEYVEKGISEGKTESDTLNDYFNYCSDVTKYAFAKIDLNSGEMMEIVNDRLSELPAPTEACNVYQGCLYYYKSGQIVEHVLATGESTTLLSVPNVTNLFVLDGNVFYITAEEDVAHFLYWNLANQKIGQLENRGQKKVMVFNIYAENTDHFLGYYNGENCLISKDDFYREAFENAVPF